MYKTRIIIDGDSCPVLKIIERVSQKYQIKAILFCSYCHLPNEKYHMEYRIVDSLPQAADMAIINFIDKEDIVVTQDYGLAALVLAKGAFAISTNGYIYSNENMDMLLYRRHLSSEIRKMKGRIKGPPKRNETDDFEFEENLIKLIEQKKYVQ
ncbi:MAG TPA: YaiI/YqxD family protein [Defluviitaleaceae bacterium]|jgi:uncharacterized protein YaiI (UPF0178 family)|nr:YaiI/YqxD family protein [Candidatus Epulonipiscium sp.]HOQ17462.1 YaiI/YqxD family protein [Defluviitaleaceae bacterium]HPT76216.1 YaiI/YqxD family protein [Defluviitaleaceae bacterium]HQD49797.1 YaiI/YqxD family protein [Defluviitaleaceae bacterium]